MVRSIKVDMQFVVGFVVAVDAAAGSASIWFDFYAFFFHRHQFARCDFKPIRPKIFVNRQENQAYRPHALEIVSLRALLYQSCE